MVSKNKNKINGTYNEGKCTFLNKNKEFIIIPILKLRSKEGINTNIDSVKRIFFNDLVFEPIARIIRKSFAFSIISDFW